MDFEFEYKKQISKILSSNEEQIFLYWKGRVAFFALLKAMNIKEGDEVIMPSFTCVVVANAIIYVGATPVYVDIDAETYNANIDNIANAITPKTKAIICQNTFGLSSNIEKIVSLAKQHNLYTIEDCTHGFGGTYKNKPNGSYSDAAFYSTQWNKPFSTGIGGFSLINNQKLIEPLKVVNQYLKKPTYKEKMTLNLLYFFRKHLLVGPAYWVFVKLYRFLSKHNLIVGSSSGEEITTATQPENYYKSLSKVQMKNGLKNLQKLPSMLELRKRNAKIYTNYLSQLGKNHVPLNQFENHSFLKYPLLVKDKGYILRLAEKKNIELGEWFNSQLHPVQKKFELWKLDPYQFPTADFAGKHIINIPTDTKKPEKVIDFLKTIEIYILDHYCPTKI